MKAGWGDWAGPGGMEVSKKILDKRNRLIMQVQKENETKRLDRKDAKHANVMISERRITNAAKYKISEVPYPFKTREEYERSLQMPLGGKFIMYLFPRWLLNTISFPFIVQRNGMLHKR